MRGAESMSSWSSLLLSSPLMSARIHAETGHTNSPSLKSGGLGEGRPAW